MKFYSQFITIKSTGSALPKNRVRNIDLIKSLDTNDEWIKSNLGIHERRISSLPDESVIELGTRAAEIAIENAKINLSEIGGIIVATSTPELKAPSTACLIQNRLKIRNNGFAFDVQAVCSGFIYALTIGANLIHSGSVDNIVIIGVDVFSQITDWEDRSCVFFGDGAGAIVLSRDNNGRSVFSAVIHADGSGHEGFYVDKKSKYFTMNPKMVYEAAIKVLPPTIMEALEIAQIPLDQVKYIVPHQPSLRVLDETARLLNIEPDRVLKNMRDHANTAGATVPLLLDQTVKGHKLSDGDNIVMAAVGSGWTWGAVAYKWRTFENS